MSRNESLSVEVNGEKRKMEKNYRCCISCRKVAHKSEFWRIVRHHLNRAIQLDQGMGRSAYLCPCAPCLQLAQKKKRLSRVLRSPVPDELYAQLWERLAVPSAPSAPTPAALPQDEGDRE